MKAVIIAGGKGERLKPLTHQTPKPMVKVNGKPVLEYLIHLFKKNGIVDLIFALCYLPDSVVNYFQNGSRFGVNIDYTFEDPNIPLGTAGAITLAKKNINGTFIVTYADILRNLPIQKMIKLHKNSKSLVTINVYKHTGNNFKSSIKFNKSNVLTSFQEFEKSQNLNKKYEWSNGSFYICEPEIFQYIPTNRPSDFSKDIFPKLLRLNKKISVYPSSDYFLDVGTKESLKKARKDVVLNPLTLDD